MTKAFTLLSLVLLITSVAQGAAKTSINRGGFGFLYSDTNHFDNPGLFSQLRGFAASGEYFKNQDSNEVTANSSVVFGNGRVGFGAFGSRAGYELNDPTASEDSVGGGFGFNFAKNMGMVGLGYSRSIDASAPNDGTATAAITYEGMGKGFAIGAAGSTTINADTDTRSGVAALGYSFNPMVQIEGVFTERDLTDLGGWKGSACVNVTGRVVYLTGGFDFEKVTDSYAKSVKARLGFILGNVVDISGYGTRSLETGGQFNYGGIFRLRL